MALNENAVGSCKAFGQCLAWDYTVSEAALRCEEEDNGRISLQEDGIVAVGDGWIELLRCYVWMELRELVTRLAAAE